MPFSRDGYCKVPGWMEYVKRQRRVGSSDALLVAMHVLLVASSY